ncbi:MAG: uroporphyrinogen decarboxylase family protein [archaeon]|nr:uroporphyrinogen decarboxylase family protein [archaeon]
MKNAGHRETIEAALNFEKTDRTPVNNFALVTAARSAGILVKDARYTPDVSAKVSVDYALKTKSDFVKPVVDSQIPFADLGMDVEFPDDDYGRVRSTFIHDVSEIDEVAFFDPKNVSECPKFDKCILQSLAETEKYLPEDLHVCGLSWGPISTAGYIMGTEDMIFAAMVGEEEAVTKLVLKCADFVADQEKAQIDAGASLMWMADPTSSEDLISPDMFPIALAGIKSAIGSVKKDYSDTLAFLHVCGNTVDLIPHIAGTGADCLSFDHAVDPAVARQKAGKDLALMGNIDPVKYIMSGTPDEITRKCYDIIGACGAEGGFILAPGCETPISSPDENVIAMGDAGINYWKSNSF